MDIYSFLVLMNIVGLGITYSLISTHKPKLSEQLGKHALINYFSILTVFTYTIGFSYIRDSHFPFKSKLLLFATSVVQWSLLAIIVAELF